MKSTAPNLQRILAAMAMCAAFLVMASVFVPLHSDAGDGMFFQLEGDDSRQHPSVDPHEGLESIGELEHRHYRVRVFATDGGPRFTLYDAENDSEIAALMSAERIAELFPELPLDSMDFSSPTQIMLLDTQSAWPD